MAPADRLLRTNEPPLYETRTGPPIWRPDYRRPFEQLLDDFSQFRARLSPVAVVDVKLLTVTNGDGPTDTTAISILVFASS